LFLLKIKCQKDYINHVWIIGYCKEKKLERQFYLIEEGDEDIDCHGKPI